MWIVGEIPGIPLRSSGKMRTILTTKHFQIEIGVDQTEEDGQKKDESRGKVQINDLLDIMNDKGTGVSQAGIVAGAQPDFQMGQGTVPIENM
jgi:hypothetical protein